MLIRTPFPLAGVPMPFAVRCPHCHADLDVTRRDFGRTLPCRACGGAVAVSDPSAAARAEPDVVPLTAADSAGALGWPVPGPLAAAVGVVAVAAVVWAYYALQSPPPGVPDTIPAGQWVVLAVPDGFTAEFPGEATKTTQAVAGLTVTSYTAKTAQGADYTVACTDQKLPAARLGWGAEQILNDSCAGALANIADLGAVEVSREGVRNGRFPGMQTVARIPKMSGQLVSRVYLADGRLFFASCGGPGYEAGQPIVARFFDSLRIADAPP